MNNQKYINLLRKEEIQEKIINLYCKLHRELWSNFGTNYHIVLTETGEVHYISVVNLNSIDFNISEENAIIVYTIDGEDVGVGTDDMGEITEVIDDLEEFKEWLFEGIDYQYGGNFDNIDVDKEIENGLNWYEYHEFNPTDFQEIERKAWYTNCELYDRDYIRDKIQQRIKSLNKDSYVAAIKNMIDNIDNIENIKRIYKLVLYIYCKTED